MLEFSPLEHLAGDVSWLGTQVLLDRSEAERFNVYIESAYQAASKKDSSGPEETVRAT